eukprot:2491385-Amphidinium_carterae.1
MGVGAHGSTHAALHKGKGDHRPVLASFTLASTSTLSTRQPPTIRSFSNEEHRTLFETQLHIWLSKHHPAPQNQYHNTTTPPSQQFQTIHNQVHKILKRTKHRTRPQLKEWIKPETWSRMEQLNFARKTLRQLHRHTTTSAEAAPLAIKHIPSTAALLTANPDLVALALDTFIDSHSKLTKKLLRRDKRAWIHDRCLTAANSWTDSKAVFKIIRQLTGRSNKPSGRALRLDPANSEVTTDPAVLHQAWLDHWTHHFHGTVRNDASFQLTHISPATSSLTTAPGDPLSLTEADVRAAFNSACLHKSSPDTLAPAS